MSTGHAGDGLLVETDSPVHRLPAQVKLVSLVCFVICVVSTPAAVFWAFGVYGAIAVALVVLAKLPAATVLRRLVVETPFLVFALLLPLVATGPTTEVLGVSLSQSGVLGAWNVLAKGTLGVTAAIVLSATTSPRDLLTGLELLRLPRTLVAILSFMVRYLSVVAGDLQRMRIARESRAYAGGGAGHLKAVAAGAGSLFVRSYERGERIHLAMLARGYSGTMPALSTRPARPAEWVRGLSVPAVALVVAVAARVVGG
jgi:cobalt/nickel transport system permease protein